MDKKRVTLEFQFERTIAGSAAEVFDAWLDPRVPGTPWHEAGKLVLNPRVDGLFYWTFRPTGTPHFGRFVHLERHLRIQHTWMSPNTQGEETTVTVTFEPQGGATLMKLVHAGIPDTEGGRSHQDGWKYFLGQFQGLGSPGKLQRS